MNPWRLPQLVEILAVRGRPCGWALAVGTVACTALLAGPAAADGPPATKAKDTGLQEVAANEESPAQAPAASGTADAAPAASAAEPSAPAAPAPDAAGPGPAEGGNEPVKRGTLTRELAEEGEKNLLEAVRVFQQRYLMKAQRVEVLAGGSLTMADPMVNHYGVDGGLLYHLNERWALGVAGGKWFGVRKDQFLQIQRDFGLFPEKSILQAGAHLEAQYSPVVGKFSSFGLAVMQVDAYVAFGAGAARTSRGDDLKPYGTIGVGARIHTSRWLTVSLEVRDMLLYEQFLNGSAVLQHIFGGIKLGFWLPPTVTYKYAR